MSSCSCPSARSNSARSRAACRSATACFDPLARGVQRHPGLAAANRAQRLLQLALSSQVADARLVQLLGGVRAGDGVERLADELVSVQEGPGSRVVGPAALASAPVPGLEPGPGKRGIQAPLHHANTITDNGGVDTYAPFAEIYEEWSAPMTEDVPFYVGLAQEADGPVVELAVGTGRVAVPVAKAIGRRMLGIDRSPAMLAKARQAADAAGVELELREGDMRELSLDEPAALIYCPYRSLLHLPTWADRRRVFERVAESLKPGGRFAWNAFVFDPHIAVRMDGVAQAASRLRDALGVRRPPAGGQPHRHHRLRRRARAGSPRPSAVVADPIRVGRPDRRVRAGGGGALRLVRQAAVRRREQGVRMGRPEALRRQRLRRDRRALRPVVAERDRGRPVLRRGGEEGRRPGRRARGRDRPDRSADRGRRRLGDRRRFVGRDAGGLSPPRGGSRRRGAARPSPRRPLRSAGQRARLARDLSVPVVPAPARRTGAAPGASGSS